MARDRDFLKMSRNHCRLYWYMLLTLYSSETAKYKLEALKATGAYCSLAFCRNWLVELIFFRCFAMVSAVSLDSFSVLMRFSSYRMSCTSVSMLPIMCFLISFRFLIFSYMCLTFSL